MENSDISKTDTVRTTMTAKDCAEYIGVSYWLLLEMCKRKEVPHIKTGKRILFRRETIDRWLENQEVVSLKKEKETGYGKLRKLHALS